MTLNQRYRNKTAPYCIELRNLDNNNNKQYEDAAQYRGIGSIINHARKGNCRFSVTRNNRIQIKAIKHINKDTELLVDYGDEYRLNEAGVRTSTNNKKYTI